jgi:ribonuclease VapC
MVFETSALLAILFGEPERRAFAEAIEAAESRLLTASHIEIVPVNVHQAYTACEVFRQFGKGRHPAGLNFGDCFACAAAKCRSELLLFKGGDFVHESM